MHQQQYLDLCAWFEPNPTINLPTAGRTKHPTTTTTYIPQENDIGNR
jgi:hypothetical protein